MRRPFATRQDLLDEIEYVQELREPPLRPVGDGARRRERLAVCDRLEAGIRADLAALNRNGGHMTTRLHQIEVDLALANQIPLYAIPDDAEFTLDQQLAFGRLTDAVPALVAVARAAERVFEEVSRHTLTSDAQLQLASALAALDREAAP